MGCLGHVRAIGERGSFCNGFGALGQGLRMKKTKIAKRAAFDAEPVAE